MERVFKIKTRSEPDLANQYPSERRYSASIVLGLSIVLVNFALYSVLMGGLIVYKMTASVQSENATTTTARLDAKLERDLVYSDRTYYLHYYINVPALIAAGCFLMAGGDFVAFVTGLFAWKRWYIDHNITLFFLTCSLSALTSFASLLISVLTIAKAKFDYYYYDDASPLDEDQDKSPLTLPLAVNIVILSLFGTIWSVLAARIGFKGMRNAYPDDAGGGGGTDKRRQVETITGTTKGQNNLNHIPIEVINNLAAGKMAKYLPKKENDGDLPKRESNAEYQQRVNSFLNDEPEAEQEEPEQKQKNIEDDEKLKRNV